MLLYAMCSHGIVTGVKLLTTDSVYEELSFSLKKNALKNKRY
jgi:hypothetical protein